ncbi:MAG: tetratricopeptide repeat protein [Eubacteriales bacterium]|nr:tetratricopeptide repeat protein [Eubacteriales bacterium]
MKNKKNAAVICVLLLLIIICAGLFVFRQVPSQKLQREIAAGHRYLEAKEYDQAILAYEAAIEIDSNSSKAYEGLGTAYLKQAQHYERNEEKKILKAYDRSIAAFENVTILTPDDADAYIHLGDVYILQAEVYGSMDKTEAAMEVYKKALEAYSFAEDNDLNADVEDKNAYISSQMNVLNGKSETVEAASDPQESAEAAEDAEPAEPTEDPSASYRTIQASEYSIVTLEDSNWGGKLECLVLNDPSSFPDLSAALEQVRNDRQATLDQWVSDCSGMGISGPTRAYVSYESTIDIKRFDTRYLVMAYLSSTYQGGAHPNSFVNGAIYDVQSGKKLTPNDVFTNVDAVASMIERKLLDNYPASAFNSTNMKDTIREYMEKDSEMYWLPDYDTLHVAFSPYVLGPYMAGEFMCEIPLEECRDYMVDPDSWLEKPAA